MPPEWQKPGAAKPQMIDALAEDEPEDVDSDYEPTEEEALEARKDQQEDMESNEQDKCK